ncbi:MAG TPA: hypothetical protein V6C72_04265 [Chroococcales cyanobacterium]
MAPQNSSDRVSQTVSRIESDNQNHAISPKKLHEELDQLRKEEMCNGHLNKDQYKSDLKAVNDKLHSDGVLPQLDISEDGNGQAALRGISTPGKTPDGKDSLVTKVHGTTFTYDQQGHVESYAHGKDKWTYSDKDGLYHETVNGKKTDKTSDDVVAMGGNGSETVTHSDGSTTTTAAWGGTVDRNADGQMTRQHRGKDTKTFEYDQNGQLKSMTDQEKGKDAVTYTRDADGHFYASDDKDHKKPLDITVEPDKNADGSPNQNGIVQIADKNGNFTQEHWNGTNVQFNKENQLTHIDYSNGNTASGFKYDKNDPTKLTSFDETGADGKKHSYAVDGDGNVTVDGGKPVKGSFKVGPHGGLTVIETGDGTDKQYHETRFGLGGSQVDLGKYGENVLPEQVISSSGKISKFQYDADGNLTSVDAHGYNLHKKGNQWVDENGKTADVTPSTDTHGNFSVTQADGTYVTWAPSGTRIQGIPDTPAAIAAEAKDANASGDPTTDPTTDPTDSNNFKRPSNAVAYAGDMTIDLDGKGTRTGGDNQDQTSYADGKLSAWDTNYVALAPGWAAAHNLHLGDVVAVQHDGKTAYAIYGDNYTGNQVHTEGSIHLARELNPGNGTDNTLDNVQFFALPGSADKLHGSISQADIDRIGQSLFT